ncbi:hypothetical protein NHX12_023772, partial [Muraenolepis orangiensis]
ETEEKKEYGKILRGNSGSRERRISRQWGPELRAPLAWNGLATEHRAALRVL